jgi:hypothetical protein
MASTTITIPSFEFSSFYYPQILEALLLYKRRNVPELTDESEFEPFIQLLRAMALVGHLNNVLIDLVANESTLPTAQLPETVRNMLRLIDYELRSATPAQADLIHKLSAVRTASTELVRDGSQFATKRAGDDPIIFFETSAALTIVRTDLLGAAFDYDGATFVDKTTEANAGTTWSPAATTAVGNLIYFGHADVMWNKLNVVVVTPADAVGVWEYYDGDWSDDQPDSVTDLGGGVLEFDLTGHLGIQNRAGATVRITLNSTGASQDVVSTWNGSENIATTGLLGQTTPSTTASDYSVGADWQELPDVVDGPAELTVTGDVEWTLPQTETRNWRKTTVNGFEGFFVRFRIITVNAATAIDLGRVRIDTGDQFATTPVTQGQSVTGEVLGSSTGAPNQRFETAKDHFIWESQTVYVDGTAWTQVDNFLSSLTNDQHYVVELGEDDRASIVFGDGNTGRIPPIGQGNVTSDYRWGAHEDGNVGANTIVVDKSGLSFVNDSYNPRQAVGWTKAQAADETSLEQAKIAGPASLRTRDVALGPDDAAELAVDFIDADGASPFARAFAVEEGFGPKTIKLIVVVSGGGQATPTQLAALDLYFNGDPTATPPARKRLIANQEATSVNFTPRVIDITATVEALAGVTEQAIINQLARVLQPEALKPDGVTWLWNFGDEIAHSRLEHEIFETDVRITKVTLTTPAGDTQLGGEELPTLGTTNITLIEV